MAVLLGDYVFAASATFVCQTQNPRVIHRFSQTIMELSSGELLEYFNTFNFNQTRQDYTERIFRKTASLFRTAAEAGAILSGAPEETVEALRDYGYNLGMAFQIIDDILDYLGDVQEVGKPVGNDLLQGILTLPAIMFLERCPGINPIKTAYDEGKEEGLRRAVAMILNSGVVEECFAVARDYCQKAARAIERLPDNPSRRSLLELTSYVMERKR